MAASKWKYWALIGWFHMEILPLIGWDQMEILGSDWLVPNGNTVPKVNNFENIQGGSSGFENEQGGAFGFENIQDGSRGFENIQDG